MKKYFIFAVAAMTAMAACTKVDIDENLVPDQKISFEVANYSVQTKAGDDGGLINEGYTTFNTYAWYYPTEGNTQTYMNNVAVNYQTVGQTHFWAPADDYFWPTTGYINFFSYAGTGTPAYSDNGLTVTYSNKTIEGTDNYLLADAAFRYNSNIASASPYGKDGVTEGVPTMFRHLLSRVNFTVKLATSADKVSSNTTWVVEILNTQAKPSNFVVKKTGSLVMKVADPNEKKTVQYAPEANSDYATDYRWVAATTGENLTETIDLADQTLTLPVSTQEIDATSLLAERTVMPQLTSGVNFTLNYKVTAKHGNDVFMEEYVTVEKTIAELASAALASWNMNKKITYNVIIDPVTSKVKFDPAVESWANEEARSINLPVTE